MSNSEDDLFSNYDTTPSDSLSISSVEIPNYLKTPINKSKQPPKLSAQLTLKKLNNHEINDLNRKSNSINDFNSQNNSFIENSAKSEKDSEKSISSLSDKDNAHELEDFNESKYSLVINWLESSSKSHETRPLESSNTCDTSFESIDQLKELEPKKSIGNASIFSSDEDEDEDDVLFALPKIETYEQVIAKLQLDNPNSDVKLSFIHSLLDQIDNKYRDQEAHLFRINYKYWKQDLAQKIFSIYNETVFNNKLPSDTKIIFNPRLLTKGGTCRPVVKTEDTPKHIEIRLSTKICSDANRLLEVLVHEMCHGATFMINDSCEAHGPIWRTWGIACKLAFPLVPLTKRCHNFKARFKYQYRCESCGFVKAKHSKYKEQKACKYCAAKLILFRDGGYGVHLKVDTNKPIVGFAAFVKENYKSARRDDTTHKEAMKILSHQFYLQKLQSAEDRAKEVLESQLKL